MEKKCKVNSKDYIDPPQSAEELEILRREIEDCAFEIGKIGDYIERFQPPDDGTIGPKLEKLHTEKTRKEKILKAKVEHYSQENFKVIEIWLAKHSSLCNQISRENKAAHRDFAIRKNLAQEILEYLAEIKEGKRYYFSVNRFYLDDYYLRFGK